MHKVHRKSCMITYGTCNNRLTLSCSETWAMRSTEQAGTPQAAFNVVRQVFMDNVSVALPKFHTKP